MNDKIFKVYLAKDDVPNSEASATLELPASPWEVQDALDKVRLQEDEELYLEIENYHDFICLMPHFSDMDISLNELNDLAGRLAVLDDVQQLMFNGLFHLKVRERKEQDSGILTMQDCRDLAVSAGADCCHVVLDAITDEQLGRFYAENDFVRETEGLPDHVFELLNFAKIGKQMREAEGGVFAQNGLIGTKGYIVQREELQTAPPCPKALPPKPDYLFRLKLGLHPDFGGDRQTTLTLPATEAELAAAQVELGTQYWENTVVLDYDGIIPHAADFADLPVELETFNEFAKVVRDTPYPEKQIPKLKALLSYFEVQDLETAMYLATHPEEYILTPALSSPTEVAIDQLHFMMDEHSAELLLGHVNLYSYGNAVIQDDHATLTPYGLLHREDYQPMQAPIQQSHTMELQ